MTNPTTKEMIEYLQSKTKKDGSLFIDFNECSSCYRTVEQEVLETYSDSAPHEFIDEEDKDKCIKVNIMWIVQWYPNTPNGFEMIRASDLDKALSWMCEFAREKVKYDNDPLKIDKDILMENLMENLMIAASKFPIITPSEKR